MKHQIVEYEIIVILKFSEWPKVEKCLLPRFAYNFS